MTYYSEDQNQFLRHEPCPNCPSSDALARYSDGGAYCFSCGYHEKGTGEVTHTKPHHRKMISYEGDFVSLRKRNLREDTLRHFNVKCTADGVKFPYYDSNKTLTGYKERDKDKNFTWVGKNPDKQFFGQQLWGSGKSIVITEGEFDCLSVYQARPTWPVVSVPTGAKGAVSVVKHQLDWLLGFDEIILMFDNDEEGQKATRECAQVLPPDRTYLAALGGYKDASEALQVRDDKAILASIWNKRAYMPQSIINGADLLELVKKPVHGHDAQYPFTGLNELTSGLRYGELVTITAGSGIGKSTICGEIAVGLLDQGHTVGYIALEESVQRTALRLMTVKANHPLHEDNQLDESIIDESFAATLGTGRVFLREGFGSIDPDVILNDIRYLVKAKDCRWVVLDHLSILMSGLEMDDERKMIDRTMTKLRSFVEETGIGMLLVSHLRRSGDNKGHEDGAKVSLGQLRGSGSIGQLSDIVIGLVRNTSAGDDMSEVVVLKNRFNGKTGPAGLALYSKETGRLTDSYSTQPTYTDDEDDF